MALELPYRFDTAGIWKTIFKGVVGFEALLIAPGLVYTGFVSRDLAAFACLAISGAIMGLFGAIFVRKQVGVTGTITKEAVTVEPGEMWGIRMPGPAGTYPIRLFRCVRVVTRTASSGTSEQAYTFDAVHLIGREGVPDIHVGNFTTGGAAVGRQLAAAVGLPFEDNEIHLAAA